MSLTAFEDDDNLTHENIGEDAVLHKGKLPEHRKHPHEAQPVLEATNVRSVASTVHVESVDPVTGEREHVAGPVDDDVDSSGGAQVVDDDAPTDPVDIDENTGEVRQSKLKRKKE